MEIKDFTTAQLIKKLRKLAREMRLESCMYATADILDEAANRLEERVKDKENGTVREKMSGKMGRNSEEKGA